MHFIKFKHQHIAPSKIVCIGRNYVEHIHELSNEIPDEPVIFIKPNSALSNEIQWCDDLHYEGELCFLIKDGKFAAVSVGIDLTKRNLQSQLKSKGLPWERAKAFNASAVFGKFVSLPEDISTLSFTLHINDKLIQHGTVDLMMFKPQQCLDSIKQDFELLDGDIIMTGTPKGVGAVHQGDSFIGTVFNGEQKLIEAAWSVT
ncbi:2-keto-4-pentenoate hydratase [Shewanella sp. OPT22]|nr:2-keto-4-pentenoate hydratase [Shewanella sp. OPT22]